jgi:hypothetical protein
MLTSARTRHVPPTSRHCNALVSGSRTVRLLQLNVSLVIVVLAMKPEAHATKQVEFRARVRAVFPVTHDPVMLPAKRVEGSEHAGDGACQVVSVSVCVRQMVAEQIDRAAKLHTETVAVGVGRAGHGIRECFADVLLRVMSCWR